MKEEGSMGNVQDKSIRGMCKIKVAGEDVEGRGRGELQDKSSRVRDARARRHRKGASLKQLRKVQEEVAGERCKRQSATCYGTCEICEKIYRRNFSLWLLVQYVTHHQIFCRGE